MTGFLEGCTPVNVIPDYVQNFTEASMYVMESVDEDFFNVLESIGLVNDEGVIDESAEVVNEGVKEVANKFIGALKSLWQKIQGWFAEVKKWFETQKKNAKEHLSNLVKGAKDNTIGKINAAMLDKVNPKKKVGSYSKFNINVDLIKKTYQNVGEAMSSIDAVEDIASAKDIISEALGGKNSKEISKTLKEKYVTSVKDATIEVIKPDFDEIKKAVFGNGDKDILKGEYTTQKDMIDRAIKTLKNSEIKAHKNAEGKKELSDEAKQINANIAKMAAFCKSGNQALHSYHTAVMSLLRARFVQYAHILSVCVRAAIAANVKAKVTKESAEVTLESLFEW